MEQTRNRYLIDRSFTNGGVAGIPKLIRLRKRLNMRNLEKTKVAIVGLGYVGLPLAVEFGRHFDTIGFDINSDRVVELKRGHDATLEVSSEELAASDRLAYSDHLDDLKDCDVYIVTVPTPIDVAKRPDLGALRGASRSIGTVLGKGNIVIYESTVYPGATEEDCAPILAEISGLKVNKDFFLGYSPERINPGDKEHRVTDILKVTSGSTPQVAEFIDAMYRKVIRAGTYRASSIRVAEAAKVIENTQRDVNIALVNESGAGGGNLSSRDETVAVYPGQPGDR